MKQSQSPNAVLYKSLSGIPSLLNRNAFVQTQGPLANSQSSQSAVRPTKLNNSQSVGGERQFKVKTFRTLGYQQEEFGRSTANGVPSGDRLISRGESRKQRLNTHESDEGTYQMMLEDRITLLDQLTSLVKNANLGHDLNKLVTGINEISRTLQYASRTEIDLNKHKRDAQSKNLDMVAMQTQLEKTKSQTKYHKLETEEHSKKLQICQSEHQRVVKELHTTKLQNEELNKKLHCLEKRIDMLLEKNLNAHQDALRNVLNALIQETEEQKRSIRNKNKEIERLKEANMKLANKNVRLTKKLDSLKTKRVGKDGEEGQTEFHAQTQDYAFDPSSIPPTLEFKLQALPTDYNNLILDLLEHGPEVFTNQIMAMDDQVQKRDVMGLISDQFVSYRDFGERFNSMMVELEMMLSYDSIQDYQVHLAKGMRQVLNAEVVQLWVIDSMTGVINTFDQQRKEYRALISHGAFHEAIVNSTIVNRIADTSIIMYRTETGEVVGDRVLVIPLLGTSRKPFGLLEVRGINADVSNQLDVQYFGLILSKVSKVVFQKMIDTKALAHELKYRDIFYTQFLELCRAGSNSEFQVLTQETIFKIFQVSQSSVLFVENDRFKKIGHSTTYDLSTGIAGQIYKLGRPQIISSIQRNVNFDENIDVNSILPVYCAPLKNREGQIEVIIQFVLKQKMHLKQDKHPFGSQAQIGFKMDSADYDAHKLCEFLQTAYNLFKKQ